MKRLIILITIFSVTACKKEDIKEQQKQIQSVPTQTIQATPKQYLIVIEREYTPTFSFKINNKEITTLTAIAYSKDKIEIIENGIDSWSPTLNGDVVKNEGAIKIKVYINNELIKEANCECDFNLTKILE